jgi:hypothetical protein
VAVGCRVRTSHWAFRSRGLRFARERDAALSSGGKLVVERSPPRKCVHESWLSIWPTRPIVSVVLCGSSAWQEAAKGDRARRVSAVRRLLPPPASVERKPITLGPMRLSWMWRVERFAAPGPPTGVGNTSKYLRLRSCPRAFPFPHAHRARYVRITAGAGTPGSHAMPGGGHRTCASRSLVFPLFWP